MTFSLSQTAAALESDIRANRLLSLPTPWADELLYPSYNGLSLRNIPHSVAAALGAPFAESIPLDERVWGGELPTGQIDRVVVFLMDGMGYLYLRQLMQEDDEIRHSVEALTNGRGPVPLTSVAPSSTAIALTALWTGGTPGQTGLLGTSMHLREYSMLSSMLAFSPLPGRHSREALVAMGMNLGTFVPLPGIAAHLAQAGIPTYQVQDQGLMGSGLSSILHRGVEKAYVHCSYSDMALRLHDALVETRGQRGYVGVYWPGVDSISHLYGAHSRYAHQEIKTQLTMLARLLNDPAVQDSRTLVMIAADHGEYDAPNIIDIATLPEARPIYEASAHGLSGDHRLGILHVREGMAEQVKATIDTHFSHALTYIDSAEALAAGFYGPAPHALGTHHRAGDLLIIPRRGWIIEDTSVIDLNLVSWHGGLDEWEMLIPLLWRVI
ncbi:alkaline phosphatase family protein [Phototrophicus methaneseepsis]|uniref:Alkaline phosphatase family protein n=1 Tax=Phototrophicus methaneseepsis TaxID=2710758 RepID=A0A7S8EC30_9CHLR|nr:alkaline phosphatase family protein [Phototrophicus methaneseepsis]QPC84230.1 alkaline phosphatase family protein [Phototrophicus methaneseepsis]